MNSVDFDGKMSGVDQELISLISKNLKIPLVYCGGVGCPNDCVSAIESGATAIAAASIFHFTRYVPDDCKKALKVKNLGLNSDFQAMKN
jgi:cyclase